MTEKMHIDTCYKNKTATFFYGSKKYVFTYKNNDDLTDMLFNPHMINNMMLHTAKNGQ